MRRIPALLAASAVVAALVAAPAAPAAAAPPRLTNLAHLDFLLDDVALHPVAGHSTTGGASVELPWTYADRNDDGTFRRIGGGDLDPATNTYSQGAFNADDVSRAAVVYLRDWRQTRSASSRQHARDVLRGLAYFQTTTGAHAGDVVLWMQPDGTLNPSAKPVELPDPSDSGPSFWLARTIWAYGEGYAAFRTSDPAFAGFLRDRLRLAVHALDREVLDRYGDTVVADGVRVPAWLITDGADATAEAVLGLAAYTAAAPTDRAPDRALARLADGIRRLAATTPDASRWPYGAILPSAESRTTWHPWASQTTAALVAASSALRDRRLLPAAVRDSGRFGPALLAAGGPDNLFGPTPTDRTQIAYGVDSRVEDLLATADRTGAAGLRRIAGLQAGWFFGANPSGTPAYDRATGVTSDGVQPDGTVNRNSGAESTIHGLLTMLALDAHPSVAAIATATTSLGARDGLRLVEAETAGTTTGTVFEPDPASTAESTWSGKGLSLTTGERAVFGLGRGDHLVEAVIANVRSGSTATPVSRWSAAGRTTTLRSAVGAKGVTPEPGALLPQALGVVHGSRLVVRALAGDVRIDALLVRPLVQQVRLGGTRLLVNSRGVATTAHVTRGTRVERFDAAGRSAGAVTAPRSGSVRLPAGGFALTR